MHFRTAIYMGQRYHRYHTYRSKLASAGYKGQEAPQCVRKLPQSS